MTDINEIKEMLDDDNYEVKAGEIKDGDIVIVKSQTYLSGKGIVEIKDMLRRKFQDLPNVKIFVLDDNIDLQILRKVE